MKVDALQSRMSTLEKYSNPALIKNELDQMKTVVNNISCSYVRQSTTDTSTSQVTLQSLTTGECSQSNQPPTPEIVTQNLRIAAWNCRGLSNGLPYIEHLADNHDIVIISEHWLWSFELHKLKNIHPNMLGAATANSRLTPECNLVRGCGGIGIIWNKSLNLSPIPGIDSDRILAVKVETTTHSILVIGVYLPTTDAPTDDFRSCLLVVEDIINNHDGPIVLAGDFNCHVGPEGGAKASGCQNLHGKLLLEMVQNNDLLFTSLNSISSGPEYTFFRGDTLTTTDYIIMDARRSSHIAVSDT